MDLPFTHHPGRRERHLRRRHENPLFAWPPREVPPEDLLAAQRADHEELEAYRESLRALVQRAIDLPPNTGSDLLLGLKESLERHYEQSHGLPEDLGKERDGIRRLIDLIMTSVRRAAGPDPLAERELADEELARALHFELLAQPIVADLLHPESPITPEELAPALLSATEDEVRAALTLFDVAQLAVLASEGAALLAGREDQGVDTRRARVRLALVQARLWELRGDHAIH